MFHSFAMKAAPAIVGLGLIGCVANAGQPAAANDEPLRCSIETSSAGGMTVLEGVVESDTAIRGDYRFSVEGSGSSSTRIRQGGQFSAGPGAPVTVGRVMLGGNADYEASLTLELGGDTIDCSEDGGGFL